jgi:hypothetical protein
MEAWAQGGTLRKKTLGLLFLAESSVEKSLPLHIHLLRKCLSDEMLKPGTYRPALILAVFDNAREAARIDKLAPARIDPFTAFKHPDANIRKAALETAEFFAPPATDAQYEAVLDRLNDENPEVRNEAMILIRQTEEALWKGRIKPAHLEKLSPEQREWVFEKWGIK